MCQVFGMNFNKVVRPSFSFRGFAKKGTRNPHGWGLARYEGSACQVVKEPCAAQSSSLSEFIREYSHYDSHTFIGHVRYMSRGNKSLANTHPFSRPFRKMDICLAHNGTLRDLPETGLKFHPVGETDSELLFCNLLTRFSVQNIQFTDFDQLADLLRGFNHYGSMNLLFSDSVHLFVYRDINRYNGLCFTKRAAPFAGIRFNDSDWEIQLREEKSVEVRGVVVATEPLTNESWQELPAGKLAVFQQGEMVYNQ